jgi:hypothetical protein
LILTPCLFWVGFVFNFVCNLIHIYSLDMGLGSLEFLALLIIAYGYPMLFFKIRHGKSSISFCNFVM